MMAESPTPPLDDEHTCIRKLIVMITLVLTHRERGGWPLPGNILFETFRLVAPPHCSLQDDRAFAGLMSDLVDAGLVVEKSGRTRVASLSGLGFSLSPFMSVLSNAIRQPEVASGTARAVAAALNEKGGAHE